MTLAIIRASRRSRFGYDFLARYCLDRQDQALTPITGQAVTFARTTTSTGADAAGATQTFAHSQPAFEWADLDADSVKETPGILLGTNDRLYTDYFAAALARTIFVDFTDKTATGASNGSRIIEIGNSGAGGAFLSIRRAAGGYDANFNNGTTSVTALSPALTVASGDRIRLRLTISSTGVCTLSAAQNAGAETSGSPTGTNSLVSWNQPRLAIGSDYAGANRATQSIYRVRDIIGAQTAAFMGAG